MTKARRNRLEVFRKITFSQNFAKPYQNIFDGGLFGKIAESKPYSIISIFWKLVQEFTNSYFYWAPAAGCFWKGQTDT